MKRRAQVLLLAALIAVFGCKVRSADAYSQYSVNGDATNCRLCHGDFRASPYTSLSDGQSWGDDLHDIHRSTMLNGDCDVCHTGPGHFPVFLDSSDGGTGLSPISCVGCHGRAEDAGNDDISGGYGTGLRQHHTAAGQAICTGCHFDADPANYTPVGEDVPPPYYSNSDTDHPDIPSDPCNLDGNENFAGAAEGLDNDGDDIYDGLDPDCAAGVPDIAVTDSVAPANDLQVPFGIVTVGSSADQTVTVTNAGTDNLVLGTVASAKPLAAPFSIPAGTDNCSGEILAPAASCTITVRFSPVSATTSNDSFDIPSNDPDEDPVTVSLSGTGMAALVPDIAVTDSVAPANDLLVPFGSVTVGSSADQTVTVTNAGTDNLVLGTVASAKPLAAPFSIPAGTDNCSGEILAPAASCTITVRFSPVSATTSNDSFDIPSNDPDEDPVTVSLSGTGMAALVPDIAVTDSVAPANDLLVPFGSVTVGSSVDQTVTVTNAGTDNLVLGTVASAIPLAAPFSIPVGTDNCSGETLAPSASCTITVRFSPTATTVSNDSFDIPSDDPDEDPVTVSLNGTGVLNSPPSAPALVLPANGATGLPATVTFEWNRSTDPDGDPVTYDLFVCTDSTFATCDPVNPTPIMASAAMKGIAFASTGFGVAIFGIIFAGSISRRRKLALLLAMALFIGACLTACHSGGGSSAPHGQVSFTATGLSSGTTYYWKVVATDDTGSTDSETRSFTTR